MGTVLRPRMMEQTSKPDMPGMLMSSTTRSGVSVSNFSTAAVPSGAFTTR